MQSRIGGKCVESGWEADNLLRAWSVDSMGRTSSKEYTVSAENMRLKGGQSNSDVWAEGGCSVWDAMASS